jgi:DNA-binding MarR family transcriptional regulator
VSADVTLVQLRVLVLLRGRGDLTMSQLAAALDVNPSTITRLCDVLVDKRMIRRRQGPPNRRIVFASLTATGERLIQQVLDRRGVLIDDALARLAPVARRRVTQAMMELAAALDDSCDHAWSLGWVDAG